MAVTTLALGIGVNTAVFSIVNTVLMHPVAGRESDRLIAIYEQDRNERRERNPVAPANLDDFQSRSRSIEAFGSMIWFAGGGANLGSTQPQRVQSALVSEELLEMMGARAVRGRLFTAEDRRGNSILISDGLWRSRFASAPDIVGRNITVDGSTCSIAGVLRSDFHFPGGVDVWLPMPPREALKRIRENHFLTVVGRLKPGVTVQQARQDLNSIALQLEREYPATNSNRGVTVIPMAQALAGEVRPALLGMLAAVALILLIACGNLSNLLLARMVAREREMKTRAALGATPWRLMRQMFVESAVLVACGAAGGLMVATWCADLIVSLAAGRLPRLEEGVPFDAAVLAFALAATTATILVFGLLPALCTGRKPRTAGGGALRAAIVTAQVALSVVVLTSAGLLIHSLAQVMKTDPGFEPQDRIAFRVSLSGSRYASDDARVRFIDEALAGMKRLPGVAAAGMATSLPVGDDGLRTRSLLVEGSAAVQPPEVGYRIASPGFFQSAGISLRSGRFFEDADTRGRPGVVVVNETAARRLWPGRDPIGRRVSFDASRSYRVIGVTGDVRYGGLEASPWAEVFLPHAQADFGRADQDISFIVETTADIRTLAPALRAVIAAVDPEQPVYGLMTMAEVIARTTTARRLSTGLLTSLAALGLLLASLGVYGITSYTVALRTKEIAIRIALGATRLNVVRSSVLSAFRSTLLGLGIGMAATPLIARLFSTSLYGTSPLELRVYAIIAALICAASLLAAQRPASRAARLDPIAALRRE